ncbi:hypothetical protein PsorP6_001503 [Peronosclerospora sorghi]|uniref:Uncharacterized protein n=1 Tax=Peronosclerospora sorghi TaxID=230839 RepID=A0ACC0WQG3_9STRA|nr:hypothetical protein PsorP6_001503 [Peronosclerospora sorghi]
MKEMEEAGFVLGDAGIAGPSGHDGGGLACADVVPRRCARSSYATSNDYTAMVEHEKETRPLPNPFLPGIVPLLCLRSDVCDGCAPFVQGQEQHYRNYKASCGSSAGKPYFLFQKHKYVAEEDASDKSTVLFRKLKTPVHEPLVKGWKSKTWKISDMNLKHSDTCTVVPKPTARQLAEMRFFRKAVITHSKLSGKLMTDNFLLNSESGIKIPRGMAYREQRIVVDTSTDDITESYKYISSLLKSFAEKNPGSFAEYEKDPHGHFIWGAHYAERIDRSPGWSATNLRHSRAALQNRKFPRLHGVSCHAGRQFRESGSGVRIAAC